MQSPAASGQANASATDLGQGVLVPVEPAPSLAQHPSAGGESASTQARQENSENPEMDGHLASVRAHHGLASARNEGASLGDIEMAVLPPSGQDNQPAA